MKLALPQPSYKPIDSKTIDMGGADGFFLTGANAQSGFGSGN